MSSALPASADFNVSALANLRSLLAIRSVALLGQGFVLGYLLLTGQIEDQLTGFAVCIGLLALLTLGGWWRSRRDWPVTDGEFLLQLLLDVIVWSALMFLSGGATNPFVSYYIVPIVVAAAVLPWRLSWLVIFTSLLAYSLLLYAYHPLPLFAPTGAVHAGRLHVLVMWFSFLFSAGLLSFFVVRMSSIVRDRGQREAALREDRLRDDQIMAVASLAAGTAHELGTPLSTMTVTVDELLQDERLQPDQRADCELLAQQLQQCRDTLRGLSRTAEISSSTPPESENAWQFTERVVKRWAVRRPGVRYELRRPQSGRVPSILWDTTLSQALENLLNNAADTGTITVRVSLSWDPVHCCISIRDRGPGLSPAAGSNPGKAILLSSSQGMGVGLMLSHASVERFGGRIELRPLDDGAEARLILPIEENGSET